jgi:hypothetical protein
MKVADYLKHSTAASGVPLKVKSKQVLMAVAARLKHARRSE